MFAVYTDAADNVQEILLSCGVQEEDEESDSMDFTAESIGDYIFDELQLLGCDFNAIEFISGDNTSVNPRLARLIEEHIGVPVPLIGCASHKLNLAVDIFVDQAIYAPLVTKVANLMKQLRTLKNASKLRRHGLLMAVIPNATRWGSLLACLLRYDEHYADLRNCDLDDTVLDMIPSAVEHRRIQELLVHLKQFETISMQLQGGGRPIGSPRWALAV
jgi:hypothetical protein